MFRAVLEGLTMATVFPLFESYSNVTRSIHSTVSGANFDPVFWSKLHQKEERADPLENYLLALSACGILFNGFVLFTALSSRELRNVCSTYLVISLSVADLLVCAGVMPITPMIYTLKVEKPNDALNICMLWFFLTTFSCAASSLNISMISIDRYIFIKSPLTYEQVMTRNKMRLLLLVVWVSAFLLALITFLLSLISDTLHSSSSDSKSSSAFVNFTAAPEPKTDTKCDMDPHPGYSIVMVSTALLLPSSIVVALHCKVYHIANRQAQVISSLHRVSTTLGIPETVPASTPKSSMSTRRSSTEKFSSVVQGTPLRKPLSLLTTDQPVKPSFLVPKSSKPDSSRRSIARFSFALGNEIRASFNIQESKVLYVKASFVLSLIVGTYLICWMPFGIYVLAETFLNRKFDINIRNVLLMLGYSNSCWNPLIYAGFNHMFRSSVKQRFQRFMRIRAANTESRTTNTDSRAATSSSSRPISTRRSVFLSETTQERQHSTSQDSYKM